MTRGDLLAVSLLGLAGASGLALWTLAGPRIWTAMAWSVCF